MQKYLKVDPDTSQLSTSQAQDLGKARSLQPLSAALLAPEVRRDPKLGYRSALGLGRVVSEVAHPILDNYPGILGVK